MLIHACLCLAVAASLSFPVTTAAAQAPVKVKKTGARARGGADPLAEAQRTTAISLITSLADDARDFREPTLRARVQARAADALWETDKDRARTLFQRAWEAAAVADEENNRRTEEDRRAQMARRGSAVMKSPPNLRREVLRLASKRDRRLGEEFLKELDEARKQEATHAADGTATLPNDTSGVPDPTRASPAIEQRLNLARQLIEDGNVESALQFADPALVGVNIPTINFLDTLRAKNAAAADQRYATLLARAVSDPRSDANTVSLLSSYVFTPHLYVSFSPGGGYGINRWDNNNATPADLTPQLRAAFLRGAASILLRPLPPPDQDRTSGGRAGMYMVIARLLPLFEQHAPDGVAALRSQLIALTPDTAEGLRDPKNSALTTGLVPESETRDRVENHLEKLDRAKSSDERDEIYVRVALAALGQDDPRAQEFVDKIEDADLRRKVRAYIDFEAVKKALQGKDKDADELLRRARGGELTHLQRAWALTEVARLLAKSQPGRAVELLEEATAEARRIDVTSPDRARALAAVATQFLTVDRTRAWEALAEVVKASNSAGDFTGEDGGLTISLQTKGMGMMSNSNAESFDLAGIFTALAEDDFNRTVEVAKGFTGESPRAVATLAVARTTLDKKP